MRSLPKLYQAALGEARGGRRRVSLVYDL